LNAQKGCCIALMNQFKHATNSALLYLIINAMAEKTVNKEEFYTLISPNKSLSLLNFALKNRRNANLLKQFYLEVYSPLLSIRDYNKLCKIATLDSTLAWLTKYEQNNQKPAIQNISVPQYTICTSCFRKTKIDDSKNTDYPECCDNCRSADFNLKLIGF